MSEFEQKPEQGQFGMSADTVRYKVKTDIEKEFAKDIERQEGSPWSAIVNELTQEKSDGCGE